MWRREGRGTDERDKVSMRKSRSDGRGAWRFTEKAQTGLIRSSSNPSMMLTGGQAYRKEELRQAERLTKTSPAGLKLKEKKKKKEKKDSHYKTFQSERRSAAYV